MTNVVVDPAAIAQSELLAALCDKHSLTVATRSKKPNAFYLTFEQGCLVLYPPKEAPHLGKKPLWVDFTQPRFTKPVARKSPLGRACGFKPNETPMVVDLTAGLGRDGWQMAGMG
ncbi:MAG TPA: hypothetical protein ENM98_04335, partial [Halothiobacillaceae bacterium]|nr:hypothetical protein [Halothiobacillaceae bacterium]